MKKNIFKFFFLISCWVFLNQPALAQKNFEVTIKLDTSLVPQKMDYRYDDGQKVVMLIDSAQTGKVVFKGKFNAIYLSLNISYVDKSGIWYYNTFFLGEKPAIIELTYEPNADQLLRHKRMVNAQDVYNINTNKVYREMNIYNKRDNMANYLFYQKYKTQFNSSDSLKKVYQQKVKSLQNRTMGFLKKHAGSYFSFWYFQHQIANNIGVYKPDTADLKMKFHYFKTVFPQKFRQSFEGKAMAQAFEKVITPMKLKEQAPLFTVQSIEGKTISLNDLKGKYVLLNFWATWCIPCMKEIPFLKSIRDKYSPEKFAVIGISRDINETNLTNAISREKLNWSHFFDKDMNISRLYGINVFPTLILLNKEGKIIYKSDYIKDDTIELSRVLNAEI
ncbi:TlpA family protein disulfide reductase [Mucilaginibacter psychrotolerans]|uniref:TlpA family protein disulfide reductase n=1 Tax=Mucilaginibacter psychrotolerans TaxID=1524096 RepID=A0A4Y8SFK4_9SPHI|nr:TlpA disulfide reductase family protein [Mucilaginibacter psychrotolerans]TFF37317.1 TlpA family protein disulfide reductase [Mucilaginibacter psychrotolerans]